MQYDLAAPQRWLESQRRSRARRAAARRSATRSRLGRRGAVALVAAMAVGVSGATAKPLKKGSRGTSVVQLQKKLGLPADGVFGPQTKRAVKRFQRRKGLVVDGIAGPATLSALGLRFKTRGSRSYSGDASAVLARIARCESGGDPEAVSPSGRYRGKYQFSRATWRSVGGTGDPAAAPESEQDRRALKLYRRAGTSPWPHCGRKA